MSDFCAFAQAHIGLLDAGYIIWHVIPRHDKALPEMEYAVGGKKLNHDKAEKYLAVFGEVLDDFEGHLADKLSDLIGEFAATK